MTIQEAIEARHSVRAFKKQTLTDDIVKMLEEKITELKDSLNKSTVRKLLKSTQGHLKELSMEDKIDKTNMLIKKGE